MLGSLKENPMENKIDYNKGIKNRTIACLGCRKLAPDLTGREDCIGRDRGQQYWIDDYCPACHAKRAGKQWRVLAYPMALPDDKKWPVDWYAVTFAAEPSKYRENIVAFFKQYEEAIEFLAKKTK